MLPVPQRLRLKPGYAALVRACDDVHLKASDLARRWHMSKDHLANQRRVNKGPAFIKLPSGSVLYPMSEVLAWELAGWDEHNDGAPRLTRERIELALSTMPEIEPDLIEKITARLLEHPRADE